MYTVLGGGREHRAARFIVWILLSLATLTKEPRSYQIKTEWCFVKKKKIKIISFSLLPLQYLGVLFTSHMFGTAATPRLTWSPVI